MLELFTVKAGQLILTGLFLSLGFYAGKKITNKIDEFVFVHSVEFRQLQAQHSVNKPMESTAVI